MDISQHSRIVSPQFSAWLAETMILVIMIKPNITLFPRYIPSVYTHDIPMVYPYVIILLPSQGVEPRRSVAVKVSLPGRHAVELVVPRREFFGPWDGLQGQVAY